MNSISEPSLSVARARRQLQRVQANWALGIARPVGDPPLKVARERMERRVKDSIDEGNFIRAEVFRYDADIERARWSRTARIIDRVQPGPFEDGGYLEFLARQAASVEIFLIRSDLDPSVEPILDRILFGTTGEATSQANTMRIGDAAVITMSVGMVYLMYQMAKAVVLSWKPTPAPKGSTVAFSSLAEDTRAVLDDDATPVELVLGTLLEWLFDGVARPPASAAPPAIYRPPLTLLSNYAERFVIAHEYGHALVDQLRVEVPWVGSAIDLAPMDKELRADLFATRVIAQGADELDRMAPNMALQGAMLAMKAHEIADRAIDIARGGDGSPSWQSTTHPPFETRAILVGDVYKRMVQNVDDIRLDVAPLHVPADTAELLWTRVRPRLDAALRVGRRLHPIWDR